MSGVLLSGVALHRGVATSIRISRGEGPIAIVQGGARATIDELQVDRADRGVTVATKDGRVRVDLIEHVFAALGGMGVHEGVELAIDGDEVPLMDGGATAFSEALRRIEAPRSSPRLRVATPATIALGESRYVLEPFDAIAIDVSVAFRAPIGEERASFHGDPDDFADRIAPARTFGWIDETRELRERGRAGHVDLASVLVLDERGAIAGCAPPRPAEAARHKLLDLIGDLFLYGGPPIGKVRAHRPGHAATHAVVAELLRRGALAES